jgi:hypothetical protein
MKSVADFEIGQDLRHSARYLMASRVMLSA